MRDPVLTVETLTLYGGRKVAVRRGGEGPTIVWLHGPHGLRSKDPVVAALARHHRVIAPLAPGYADVDELDHVRDVHELALHYDDILDALGLDRVALVGHSFGAMIAAELAAHVPGRVARLVLLSPFGLWRDDHPVADLFARPYATIDKLLWKRGEASAEMLDPANFSNDPVERAVSLAQAMTAVAKFIWPIPDKGLARRLHRIRASTLIVHGADDAFVPAIYADAFATAIPGARKAIVTGAGHMAPYERTDEVLALVDAHVGGAS